MTWSHHFVFWIQILAARGMKSGPDPPDACLAMPIHPGNGSWSSSGASRQDVCFQADPAQSYIKVHFYSLNVPVGKNITIYEYCKNKYNILEKIRGPATTPRLIITKQNCPIWIKLQLGSECSFIYEYSRDCPVLTGDLSAVMPMSISWRHDRSSCVMIHGKSNNFIDVAISNLSPDGMKFALKIQEDGPDPTIEHTITSERNVSTTVAGTSLRISMQRQNGGGGRASADFAFIFRGGQQSGPLRAVWVVVLVLVGALLLVAMVVVLMRYRRKHTYVHRGDSEKKMVSDASHGVQSVSEEPVHLSGNDVVYNTAYQSSREIIETKIEGAVYNTAYQSAECVGNTAANPTPVPRKPAYEYAYAHARTSLSDQGPGWSEREQANEPVHPRKEDTYAEQMKTPNRKSAHEYAYAGTENAMPASANNENQKGQVYNVAYQSVDVPGVSGTGKKNGDAYCYVASPRPTAPLVTDAMEFTGDADYSYATPHGAVPSSKRGNMEVGQAYNVADLNVGNQSLENPGVAPEYMTVLD